MRGNPSQELIGVMAGRTGARHSRGPGREAPVSFEQFPTPSELRLVAVGERVSGTGTPASLHAVVRNAAKRSAEPSGGSYR